MSETRPGKPAAEIDAEYAGPDGSGPVGGWIRFWFTPVDPIGLHAVRVLAGLVFLSAFLPLAGEANGLFGLSGWFDRWAYPETFRLAEGPPRPITWSMFYLCGLNATAVTALYWVFIAALALFTLGVWTRVTAIVSWVAIVSFTASPAIASDADSLLVILAFYLMIGYVLFGLTNRDQSLASRLLGSRDAVLFGREAVRDSVGANVALRLLQIHVAIVMVITGLHKLQSPEWWTGLALWYPLHPPMQFTPTSAGSPPQVASSLTWLGFCAYVVLAWQIAFPAFAWRRRWRPVLIGGAIIGWIGCVTVYRSPVFGPALVVSCLSYVSDDEWRRLGNLLGRVPGLQRVAARPDALSEPLVSQPMK
jgi:hypothetical protein